ncbi:MAG: sensor histidine kinase [Methanothrix sp.]
MISPNAIEPGVLKNFRLFIGVRLALVLNSLLYLVIWTGWSIASNLKVLIVIVIFDAALLFVFLSCSRLISIFKKFYLPIAIIWATLGPMVQVYLGFLFTESDMIQISTYFITPLPFLVMFIPLVIVAWQYNQRFVFYFCVSTFLLDCLFSIQVFSFSTTAFVSIISIALIRTILFLVVGNMITRLMKVQHEQRKQLTEANDKLVRYAATMEQLTISRERNRMARELHDLIAHTMSGVAVELEGVKAMSKVKPQQADELLDHSLLAIRQGLTETRRALKALRSSPLEDLGLGLSIRNLVDAIPNSSSYKLELQIDNNIQGFPVEVEHCFYRIAQEALNNIVSYAHATTICITLNQEGTVLKLSIIDNGTGFNVDTVDRVEKYGLLGMQERTEMIGGLLIISSQPGSGTKIELIYGNHA